MTNVVVISNIANLRTYSGGSGSPGIWVEGYSSSGDGGEGMFNYVSTDTSSADNSGTIIIDASGNRYYREQHRGPYNILWFGGNPNGSSDNTTALNNALIALPSGGGQIFFPPGKFLFNSTITYNIPSGVFSVSFVGSGSDASILYWPGAMAGFEINASNPAHTVHYRDMALTTGESCGYACITITQSSYEGIFDQSDFIRVTFRGDTAVSGSYWGFGISIQGLSNVSYDTLLFNGPFANSGTGISLIGGDSGPTSSIVHNISKCGFFGLGVGIVFGPWVQGVTVTQCNFTNGGTGISFSSQDTGGTAQATIIGNAFNTTLYQIDVESALADLYIIGNDFYIQAEYAAININSSGNSACIQGNTFQGLSATGSYGVLVTTGPFSSGVVTGNVFNNLAVGVDLAAATGWNVQANIYSTVATPVMPGSGNSVGVATH